MTDAPERQRLSQSRIIQKLGELNDTEIRSHPPHELVIVRLYNALNLGITMSNKDVSSGFYADLVNRLLAHLDYLQFHYKKLRDSPQKIDKLFLISNFQEKGQLNEVSLNTEVKSSEKNYN